MIGLWTWTPFGPIRTSTLVGAVLVFGIVTIVRRDPLRGLVTVIAWTALFETLYHVVGIVGYHWPTANFAWGTAALAGWIILAAVLGIWPDWRLTALFVVLMGVWIATGFHYNVAGQTAPINVENEILNEAAKISLGMAYLAGALRRSQKNELMESLVDRDRDSGIGSRSHFHGVGARMNRTHARRVGPDRSVTR